MALSRTLLRAVGTNPNRSAKDVLLRVNELLLRDTRSDLFVTLWYGIWDTRTGHIDFSSAGHNPPLVVRADGTVEQLISRGIALGVIPTITLNSNDVTLNAGDVLVVYTDGVTEAIRSDQTEFSVIGLQATATSLRHRAAQAIADGILKAVDTFAAGEPQFDDLTLIVLKHLPDQT